MVQEVCGLNLGGGIKKERLEPLFLMWCPYWAQVRSHLLGYIPGPIGILFAIALYIPWGGIIGHVKVPWRLEPLPNWKKG